MIKKFLGEVRTGVVMIFRTPLPVWFSPWWWAYRYGTWRDRRGPRRPVSRSRVVRGVKALAYQFGPAGWLWAVLAVGWLAWATYGAGLVNGLVIAVGALAWWCTGAAWTRRNTAFTIYVEDDECQCHKEEGP